MDLTLLHPKIVHLPMALAVLMPLISAGLAIAWWREWLPRRVWALAIVFQALLVATGFAAMQSGEQDEEPVERVVAEHLIEVHEEAAERFVWSSAVALLLIGGVPIARKEHVALKLAGVATAATIATLGLGYQVGAAGGALVYEHGAANAFITSAGPGGKKIPATERSDSDDDDDDDDDDDHDDHDD